MAVDGVALASKPHHGSFDVREPEDIVDIFDLRQKPMDFEQFESLQDQVKYVESRHQITLHVLEFDEFGEDVLLRQALPIDDNGQPAVITGDHNFA